MTGSPEKWSTTAASNSNADPDVNWTEGQPPSSVNDSARGMMAGIANLLNDQGGAILSTGTANALTLTTGQTLPTLSAGIQIAFRAATSNTGAATLAVNGGAAIAIQKNSPTGLVALSGGEIVTGNHCSVEYDASGGGVWVLTNSVPATLLGTLDAEVTVASAATTNILGAASALIAISGAVTITSLGTGASRLRFVRFTGAPLLTHNATTLILPSGANIQAAAGDTMIVESDASSNARVLAYQRATGQGILSTSQVLDAISSTRGTLLYRGASAWSALAPGTAGQMLVTAGAGADPSWDATTYKLHPRAWGAVFVTAGTPNINDSVGIASISDTGVGILTVNLSTAMLSTSYAIIATCSGGGSNFAVAAINSTSQFTITNRNDLGAAADPSSYSFAIFGV